MFVDFAMSADARVIGADEHGPDWSKGPADATRWGAGCEQWTEAFYKFEGRDTYYASLADIRRGWVQLDTPLPVDRVAQLIARPVTVQPVVLPARSPLDLNSAHSHDWDQGYNDGWNALTDKMAKLGPLYIGPDADEVARLSEVIEQQKSLIKSLRADLRESISIGAADAPQWDGQGIPPVDLVVEYEPKDCENAWRKGEVVALKRGGAVVLDGNGDHAELCYASNLRPVTLNQIAEKRSKAAQEWLKGIERDYGQEAADKCEYILMEAESRKAGVSESRPALAGGSVEREREIVAELQALRPGAGGKLAVKVLAEAGFRKAPGYDDLLAVLTRALDSVDGHHPLDADIHSWQADARAAIAKARGKS